MTPMRGLRSATGLLLMAAGSAAGLLAPVAAVGALLVGSFALLRKGRRAFLLLALLTIALDVVLLAWLAPGHLDWRLGPFAFGREGALAGLAGGVRLAAVAGLNLAVLSWVPPEQLLDGTRLPRLAKAFVAAVVLAAHDVARDAARLRDARRLHGGWPEGRWARVRASAGLLPVLLVAALRRGRMRRDALRLAGIATRAGFAPLVALTALAVAGRLALTALPNISLVYVVVFLGGLLFGPWVGAGAGLASMAITDLLLTGLQPAPFANAPAMALLGLLGAALRPWASRTPPPSWLPVAAALCGLVGTVLFSVAADAATWALVPEFRGREGGLRALVLAGLAFNVVPALVNTVLFAAATGPTARAVRAYEAAVTPPRGRDPRAPSSPARGPAGGA